MSVNSKMTAIADAIRAKTGGTEKLTLDGMASAIAGISADSSGGIELPSFITEINFGTFSYASTTGSISVEHGLSAKPTGFAVWRGAVSSNPGVAYINAAYGHSYKYFNTSSGGAFYGTTWVLCGSTSTNLGNYSADATSFDLYSSSYTYMNAQAGVTYYWIAWR